MQTTITGKQFHAAWAMVLIALVGVQYLRPQDIIPSLQGAPLFAPVAGISLLFVLFYKRTTEIFQYSQIRLISAFLIWNMLLLPFALSPSAAVDGLIDFMVLLPFVASIVLLVDTRKKLQITVDLFIVLMCIIAILGTVLRAGDFKGAMMGIGNFLEDPNDYALYMCTMLPINYFMFIYEKRKLKKLFYLTATGLAIAAVIISYSRGGFLAMLCVGVTIMFFSPNKKITFSLAAIAFVVALAFSSDQWKEAAVSSFDTQQSTAQTRLTTWKISLRIFRDYPQGIGINNLPGTMYKYADPWETPMRWWGNVNHSFWLTILAEGGIIGSIIMLMLLYHNARDCFVMGKLKQLNDDFRYMKYFGLGYFGSLVGFLSAGTFLTVNYYPHIWYMTGIIAAGGHVLYKLQRDYANENSTVHKHSR